MNFDPKKIQASTLMPGLQDIGPAPQAILDINDTIPIGGTLTRTMDLDLPRNDVIALVKLNVTGGNVGAYWIPVMGNAMIYDGTIAGAAISNGYLIYATVGSAPRGRRINLQFVNETVGAAVGINLRITAKAHLYAYPW